MKKILLCIVSIIIGVLLITTLIACEDVIEEGYSLELVNKDASYEFTIGEIDWDSITFYVYDELDNVLSIKSANETMVKEEDLSKLETKGTKTIEIVYQGASLFVTIKLNEKVVYPSYTLTFNAGEGTFNTDGTDTNGSNVKTITTSKLESVIEPLRNGYKFEGWYEDPSCTGARLVSPYVPKRDMTFYAKWSDVYKHTLQYINFKDGASQGIIETQTNIDNNTRIILRPHQTYADRVFVGYEIYNSDEIYNAETSIVIKADSSLDSYEFVITYNTIVRILYETKMITLTYLSSAWTEGQIVNGVTITAGRYVKDVPYGTILSKDVAPVPVVPNKVGYTGKWLDDTTGEEPIYGSITTNLVVRAEYSILSYKVSFYDELQVENEDMARIVEYGGYMTTEPKVPTKDGHTGYWAVLNDGHVSNVENGQLVQIPLLQLQIVKDVKVFAQYVPNDYNVSFIYRLPGMSMDHTETFTYKYNSFIEEPVDLSVNKIIDNVEYVGYNPKYYAVRWFAGNNEVSFNSPVQVKGNVNYKAVVDTLNYVVDFRLPSMYEDRGFSFEPLSISVTPNGLVQLPQLNEEGYELVDWYYIESSDVYDETAIYSSGTYVFYNGAYYMTVQDGVSGIVPINQNGNTNPGWMKGEKRISYALSDYPHGVTITDFHEYNENPFYDRAFYANIRPKNYNVVFNNLIIENGDGVENYVYKPFKTISVVYDTLISNNEIPEVTSLTVPTYPSGVLSSFVFEGWYLESDFTSRMVDFTALKVKQDIQLYPKWTDELKGTDGLDFAPYSYENDGKTPQSYKVVGFYSNIAEFSDLTLRIPNTFENKPVVYIESNAFSLFDKVLNIENVVLPNTLVDIGDNAFTANFATKSFDIQDNQNFVYEDGVLYSKDKTIIYACAINSTEWLEKTSYIIPSSVTTIRGGAFANATNLINVSIEGINFENGSFNGDGNLISIGDYAFSGCYSLSSFVVPNSLTKIGKYAFKDNLSLTNVTVDAEASSLIEVGFGAFENAERALRTNGDYLLFANVLINYIGNDEELVLLDNIISIADGAFDKKDTDENSSNFMLKKLTVLATSKLLYIGHDVFLSCSSLSNIYILTQEKVEVEYNSFSGVALSCKLYVNSSIINDYTNDDKFDFFGDENIIGA